MCCAKRVLITPDHSDTMERLGLRASRCHLYKQPCAGELRRYTALRACHRLMSVRFVGLPSESGGTKRFGATVERVGKPIACARSRRAPGQLGGLRFPIG